MEATWISLILVVIAAPYAEMACTFPTDLSSSTWVSTYFGTMTITTDQFTVTEPSPDIAYTWICHETDNVSKYVIRTSVAVASVGLTGYYYYCLDLTRQNGFSYSFYLQSAMVNGYRRMAVGSSVSDVNTICTESLSGPEYNVMLKSGNEGDAKQTCADPLHGDFDYTFNDGTDRCGSSPGTGRLATCTSTATLLTFDLTACTTEVAYSANGIVNCVATLVSGSTYYQTVYNTDSSLGASKYRFTCMTLTMTTGADGSVTTSMSQRPTNCESGQTSTVKPTGGALATLISTTTCAVTTTTVATTTIASEVTESDNSGLIIGIAVGVACFVIILIVIAVLLYFFVCRKKEPDNIIHVEENAKPKFEDETRHTPLTRDDVDFDFDSPSITSAELMNGNIVAAIPMGSTGYMTGNDSVLSGRLSGMNGLNVNGKPGKNGHTSGISNGHVTPDMMSFREKPGDKSPPGRPSLNPGRETMVIFNGDEKVLAGNDSRVVTNGNVHGPARTNIGRSDNGNFVRMSSIDENRFSDPHIGSSSPGNRETVNFPTMPHEKSNLMPPIETADPEKDSFSPNPHSNGR